MITYKCEHCESEHMWIQDVCPNVRWERTEANRCSCGHWLQEHLLGGMCAHWCDSERCELRAAFNAARGLFRRGMVPQKRAEAR